MQAAINVKDALLAICAAQLTSAKRIPNAYFAQANSQLILANGYGVALRGGEPGTRELNQRMQVSRGYDIHLVRLMPATSHDATTRDDVEEAMVLDAGKILVAVESESTLGQSAIKSDYTGDSGIEFLSTDRGNYLLLTISFNVLYSESLT